MGQAQSKSAIGVKRPRRLRGEPPLETAAGPLLLLALDQVF